MCPEAPALLDSIEIFLSKRLTPLAYDFVADSDISCGQSFFNVTIAERESEIQPNCMADNLPRVAITRVHFSCLDYRILGNIIDYWTVPCMFMSWLVTLTVPPIALNYS
jgi:hypothetical protein